MRLLRTRNVTSHVRPALLVTTAIASLASAPAIAQSATSYRPVGAEDIAFQNEAQIVVSPPNTPGPGTPNSSVDTEDVTGIGQMIAGGSPAGFGTCTGSLINPRTVLFAAHCVNDIPQEAYGVDTGGVPIGFGFRAENLDGVLDWFFGGLDGSDPFTTKVANYFYNANQVKYNSESLALGPDLNFLQADVALASLDTPAANIPTWLLLFSALPTPETIDPASGTGYHVTLSGYGRTGTGLNGDTIGVDFRRRVAENMLGVLGSIDDRNIFLFGSPSGLPQNLYQLDFDDPRRGTASASPFDFNVFRDDALPREGTTAGGDSGGPLILDETFDEDVVIGVLSGGSRFFAAQPFSAFGTTSFYQPLYLFWDYIAANNPYRYVGSVAGDRNWNDPNHWVTNLDPAYRVIGADGNLVNGIPTDPGAGVNGEDPNGFGQVCFQSGTTDECVDLATGDFLVDGQPTEAVVGGSLADSSGRASIAPRDDRATGNGALAAGDGDISPAALPTATLANGLPGATGFVPNNIDPDPTVGRDARYFDVTLAAAGTTTLTDEVEIDRLGITGAGARLNIATTGSLTSLIDITQRTGVMQVDGNLSTLGDYFLFAGGLTGGGTINTRYLTSAAGMIAPGTIGGVGTLTINGAVALASASNLLIDLGPGGQSDMLVVNALGSGQEDDGVALLGGAVGFAGTTGYTIRAGDTYTIVEAENGVRGEFEATPLSAILTPVLSYGPNEVTVEIEAGLYADAINPASPVQSAYAQLLDQNRGAAPDQLSELYGTLDLLSQPVLRDNLEALAPRTPALQGAMATVATDVISRFIRDRIGTVADGGAGGTVAMYGRPVQLAAMAASNVATAAPQSDAGMGASVREGGIADDASVFLAGGYIDGRGSGLPGASPAGRSDFDGYFIAAGVEKALDENGFLGFAFSYSDLDGTAGIATQTGSGELYQGTLYGAATYANGLTVDAQVSAGAYELRSSRSAPVGASAFTLTSRDRAFAFSSEGGVGFRTGTDALSFTPRAAIRYNHIGFTPTVEEGGPAALQYDAGSFDSLQARGGVTAKANIGTVRPFANVTYVHEFEDRPAGFGANFVGGIGPSAIFALPGTDKDWGEISGGLTIGGERLQASLSAETTVNRSDLRNQSYRASVTLRF